MIVFLQNTAYTISLLQTPTTDAHHDLLKFLTGQHAPQEPIIESFDRERFLGCSSPRVSPELPVSGGREYAG
jgi:hypothetical protein